MPQLCYKGADGQWHPLSLLVKGKDGLTTSVNGVAQVDGNITLTASSIPRSAVDATTVQTALIQRNRTYSLLDNGDFLIAQAGYQQYHGGTLYACDRWGMYSSNGAGTVTFDNGLKLTPPSGGYVVIYQQIPDGIIDEGKNYTLAWKEDNGTIGITHNPVYTNAIGKYIEIVVTSIPKVLKWADLYEGTYTADTLPAHVPKGYAAELAECMRYFQRFPYSYVALSKWTMYQGYTLYPIPMRVSPTVSIYSYSTGEKGYMQDFNDSVDVAGATPNLTSNTGFRLQNGPGNMTPTHIYQVVVEASADL